MIQLQTKRLIIRDHTMDDLLSHHMLFSNRTDMYYLQDLISNSITDSKDNLQKAIDEIGNPDRKFYFFRIEDKQTKEHIGEIGYTVIFNAPVGKHVGVGYFIRQDHWRKGYTTEALKEVIRFAFEENNIYRISCGCIKDNVGSEGVMIKCGMIKEAYLKHFVWHDGKLKDRVEYRLLKEEWISHIDRELHE